VQTRFSKLFRFSWTGLLVLIIVTGVLVSFGRLASPYLDEFKSDIESEISALLSSSVSIDKINTKWAGFGPKLELHDIVIQQGDDDASTLYLRQVDLDLGIKSLFSDGQFLPWNITLHGLSLRLTMNLNGEIQVVGISNRPSSSGSSNYSLEPLFELRRIELVDTQIFWVDETGRTPSTHFEHLDLLMRNDDERHQFDLTFSIADKKKQNIKIAADIRADIDSLENMDGEFYIEADNVRPINWLKSIIPANVVFNDATSSATVWISAKQGQISSAQGQVEISNMSVQQVDNQQPLKLDKVSSEFNWQQNGDQQLFELNDFELHTTNKSWPSSRLYYKRQADEAFFSLDHFHADFWPDVLPFLSDEKLQTLKQFNLAGQAHNIKANWKPDFSSWFASVELDQVSVTPALKEGTTAIGDIQFPGIENLSGKMLATQLGGKLSIDSEASRFSQPGLFRDAIPIKKMAGELNWYRQDNAGWIISSDHLLADTPHINTTSRIHISLPAEGSIEMDIQTDFRDGDASQANLFYPAGIMNPNLVQWLDRSIVSGKVTSGSFILKGPIEDFAYSKTHNGRFEVLFDVEDLILDYMPEWPRLEEVNARIRFLDNSLFIDLVNGQILDTDVSGATASIPSLNPLQPIQITGETRGPVSDNLRILAETPLKESFSNLASAMTIKGNNRVNLDFKIPLGDIGDYELDGRVKFSDNRLSLTDWNLQIDKINGELLFDLDGLSSRNLVARTYGAKTRVKVSHEKQNTLINSRLTLNDKEIRKIIKTVPKDLISGRSDWQVNLTIPPLSQKSSVVTLNVLSDLQGTHINAPAPFGKTLSSERPLDVKVEIGSKHELPISFNYGDDIQGEILVSTNNQDEPVMEAAQIHLGKSPIPQNRENHLQVSGSIDKIELDGWLEWINQSSSAKATMPVEINLGTDELHYQDWVLTKVNFQVNQDQDKLSGNINSHEIAGMFELDSLKNLKKVSVSLDKAQITLKSESETEAKKENKAGKKINPAKLPAVSLIVKNLIINDEPFGKLLLETTQAGARNGIKIETLFLTGDNLQADISGQWLNLGDLQKTDLIIDLNSQDLGKTLKQLGYAEQIHKGQAEISGQLNWLESPFNLEKSNVSGQLDLEIEDGRFLELEPGVGRILGILNIAAISRRLTLDFSDLFKDGFTFDEITGNFTFDDGNAYTEDLTIKSPSALLELKGRTGIVTQDYDQVITVTPSVQSSLTIAGAVAGGPAGAAIGFVAQKLIGDEVDKIARTRYRVKGPWDKPEITKLKKTVPVVENKDNSLNFE
jgi:uncharacterized protein (TIGR02099 family)